MNGLREWCHVTGYIKFYSYSDHPTSTVKMLEELLDRFYLELPDTRVTGACEEKFLSPVPGSGKFTNNLDLLGMRCTFNNPTVYTIVFHANFKNRTVDDISCVFQKVIGYVNAGWRHSYFTTDIDIKIFNGKDQRFIRDFSPYMNLKMKEGIDEI